MCIVYMANAIWSITHSQAASLCSQYAVVVTQLANSIACSYVVCSFVHKLSKKTLKFVPKIIFVQDGSEIPDKILMT